MKREEQTDEVKLRLWELVFDFVNKWWLSYYPQYKGGNPSKDDLYDLAADFYTDLLEPKGRGEKKESFLDKWDPGKVHDIGQVDKKFAALVKIMIQRKLIDRSRTDKGEIRYSDKYNDENPDRLSMDFLSLIAPKGALGVRHNTPEELIKETLSEPKYANWKFNDQGLFNAEGEKVAEDLAGAIDYLDIDTEVSKMSTDDPIYIMKGLNEKSLAAAKSRWKDKPMRARKEVQEDFELYKDELDPQVAEFISKVIYDSKVEDAEDLDFSTLDSVSESEYDQVVSDLGDQLYDQFKGIAYASTTAKWSKRDLGTLKVDLKGWDTPFLDVKLEQVGDTIIATVQK